MLHSARHDRPRLLFAPLLLLISAVAAHSSPAPIELPAVAIPPCAAGERPPVAWTGKPAPLTVERIRALPAEQQEPWITYLENSNRRRQLLVATRPAVKPPKSDSPAGAAVSRGLQLNANADYYQSESAAELADRVVTWQVATGGWVKGGDYTRPRTPEDDQWNAWSVGTFDNRSTLQELRFLARMISAAGPGSRRDAWQAAFQRGLDYVFAAQYPNGGYPQIYPLAGGYHDAITFNDDAFALILHLLADVAGRKTGFAFVPESQVTEAAERLARGVDCVVRAQFVSASGVRTLWGQQHDPLTLAPVSARAFEPVSAASAESVGLVLLLMSLPNPGPDVIRAVDACVSWHEATALRGVVWDPQIETGTGLVEKADAPALWSRLYELGTSRPIFGARDRTIRYAVTELPAERRAGYSWLGSRAAALPAAHAKWKERLR